MPEKSTEGNKKEQKKTGETVSTVHISSDSTPNLPSNSEKTKPKKANKRRKKKSKSTSNKQTDIIPYCPKTGPVTDDDEVITVGESTKQTKHQPLKKQETTQSTCNQNKPAKKRTGPGHEEVICRGHKTRGEDNDAGVEQGFSTKNTTDSPYDGTAANIKRSTKCLYHISYGG